MLIFLLILLIVGLGGFGYWAYTQGYLKSILKFGSDNTTKTSQGPTYTTPPAISNIKVTGTGTDGFNVTWDTDQLSSSQVEYGPKGSYTGKTDIELDPTTGKSLGTTSHGVTVKGLSASTDYQYRVISKNKDGLESPSDVNYVSTPAAQ